MHIRWIVPFVLLLPGAAAVAMLPAPTPEEAQAVEARKEQEKANTEKQKILLEKAQDRVVEHYKRTHGRTGANAARGGQTGAENIPRPAVVPARTAGPQGGREQSAEAHSAPAK